MTNTTQSALRGQPREQYGNAATAFGGIDKSAVRPPPGRPDYVRIQHSEEFRALRRRVAWFVFPMTAVFLVWYVGYVLIAAYLHDFMAQRVFGEINVGLLFGVGQFVSTVAITGAYARFARRHIDPKADEIRQQAGDLR